MSLGYLELKVKEVFYSLLIILPEVGVIYFEDHFAEFYLRGDLIRGPETFFRLSGLCEAQKI